MKHSSLVCNWILQDIARIHTTQHIIDVNNYQSSYDIAMLNLVLIEDNLQNKGYLTNKAKKSLKDAKQIIYTYLDKLDMYNNNPKLYSQSKVADDVNKRLTVLNG